MSPTRCSLVPASILHCSTRRWQALVVAKVRHPQRKLQVAPWQTFQAPHRLSSSTTGPPSTSDVHNAFRTLISRVIANAVRDEDRSILRELLDAHERLQEEQEGKCRVVVYPSEDSASQNLVTVLLDDPLSGDADRRTQIRDRWKVSKSELTFEYGTELEQRGDVLRVPSPWLSKLPIILTESRKPPDSQGDIPIVVLSPLSIVDLDPVIKSNPHALVLVNATASEETTLNAQESLNSADQEGPRVIFVNMDSALRAINILAKEPTFHLAIQSYQKDYLSSNFPNLISALQHRVSLGLAKLRSDTAKSFEVQLIRSSEDAVKQGRHEIADVREEIVHLRGQIEGECKRLHHEVLGVDETAITVGIERAAKEIAPLLSGIRWWKLPFVVDDLSSTISSAVEKAYSKQFENALSFHTGRLAALQSALLTQSSTTLSILPPSFQSPLLTNNISQISSHPSFRLTPTTLHAPLHSRTSQLMFPTTALHRTASRLLVSMFSLSALSSTSAYWAWMGSYVDGATAIGGGVFVSVLGLRWAVGRWERARKAWWGDYHRIGQGLGRDLKRRLDEALEKQVFVVPKALCDGLEKLAEKREKDLDGLSIELEKLGSQTMETTDVKPRTDSS